MSKPDMHKQRKKYLDGEMLFKKYWTEMGTARTYDALIRFCIANDIVNPFTGKPPNRMSVSKAMWRWAVRKKNFEVGYEIVNAAMKDEAKFMSKEEWREFLYEKVGMAYQHDSAGYKRFLKRNGYEIQPSD